MAGELFDKEQRAHAETKAALAAANAEIANSRHVSYIVIFSLLLSRKR
jgi:hypothetical protein